jgi:hypothetical protein
MSPARSKAQRRAMAIAENAPEELYGKNKGLLKMTKKQLHDFASTKEKGLPEKVKPKKVKNKHPRKKVSKKK